MILHDFSFSTNLYMWCLPLLLWSRVAALIAARAYFRKELLSARPRRRRFKTCSGQELKMKNEKRAVCSSLQLRRRTHGSFHINWTYAATWTSGSFPLAFRYSSTSSTDFIYIQLRTVINDCCSSVSARAKPAFPMSLNESHGGRCIATHSATTFFSE